ncbi:hypothetical protein AX16_005167 [Volvariella volvacea WC 439]|nr:hypothetical protein AX16_005167 [Volvariella volvacea WC 439]
MRISKHQKRAMLVAHELADAAVNNVDGPDEAAMEASLGGITIRSICGTGMDTSRSWCMPEQRMAIVLDSDAGPAPQGLADPCIPADGSAPLLRGGPIPKHEGKKEDTSARAPVPSPTARGAHRPPVRGKRPPQHPNLQTVILFPDSKSVLQRISRTTTHGLLHVFVKFCDALQKWLGDDDLDRVAYFAYVPGHAGILENESVDKLARPSDAPGLAQLRLQAPADFN